MFKPALGWRKRQIAMMHITKTWVEDGKMITEIIPAENIYKRQEWVGLTDEEIEKTPPMHSNGGYEAYARAIEAILKEKNT